MARRTPNSRQKACMRGHGVKVNPKSHQGQTQVLVMGHVIHPWQRGSARSCSNVVRHFARRKKAVMMTLMMACVMRDEGQPNRLLLLSVASAAGRLMDRACRPDRPANVGCWRRPDCKTSCCAALC